VSDKKRQDKLNNAFDELRQKASRPPSIEARNDSDVQIPVLGRNGGSRTQDVSYIRLNDVVFNEKQVRTDERYNDEEFAALVASIKEKGVLQPVLVIPVDNHKYRLIAGNRRYRACMQLRLQGEEIHDIPAKVLLGDIDEYDVLELQLIENLQRKDLNPVEEARGYFDFYRAKTGKHEATIQDMINDIQNYERDPERLINRITGELPVIKEIIIISGKSASYIKRLESILRLPDDVLKAVGEKKLGKYQALVFVENIGHGRFSEVFETAIKEEMTVAQIREMFAAAKRPPVEVAGVQDAVTTQDIKEEVQKRKRGGEIAFFKKRIVQVGKDIEKNRESITKEYAEELLKEVQGLVKKLKAMVKY